MITAIDTNVLLDILVPNEEFYEVSAAALQECASAGALVICDLVYAELCIHFTAQRECDAFLEANEIRVQPLTREAHFLASRTWRTYRRGDAEAPATLVIESPGQESGQLRRQLQLPEPRQFPVRPVESWRRQMVERAGGVLPLQAALRYFLPGPQHRHERTVFLPRAGALRHCRG
jgi:hypothetical protein